MDPNAALAEIHEMRKRRDSIYQDALGAEGAGRFNVASDLYSQADDMAVEVLERYAALDEWLTKGGALPDAWQR